MSKGLDKIDKLFYSQILRRPVLGPLKNGCIIKHLYKAATKQMWYSLAGF